MDLQVRERDANWGGAPSDATDKWAKVIEFAGIKVE
jgi:hypothetical protein